MQKLLETSIVHHLKDKMKQTSSFQFGFKPGTGTGEAILRLNMRIRQLRQNTEASGILFIDFKKAFDSVNRSILYKKMEKFGIAREIISVIEAIHINSRTELDEKHFKVSCEFHRDPRYHLFCFAGGPISDTSFPHNVCG